MRRAAFGFAAAAALALFTGGAPAEEARPPVSAATLSGHGGPIKGVISTADGAEALSASFDYAVGLWDLRSNAHVAWLDGHEAQVNAVAATPDGLYAVSASDDFTLIVWDLAAARAGQPALLRRLQGHQGKVAGVALSPDGALAASAGWDGVAKIWRLPDGGLAAETPAHGAAVTAVAFAPSGAALLTGGADGRVRLWRTADGSAAEIIAEQGFAITALVVAEAPSGAPWVAFGSADGVVRVLRIAPDGATLGQEARFEAERTPILALAVSPSGERLAAGDGAGGITLYRRLESGDWEIEQRLTGARRGPVWSLAFAGADRLLASGLDPNIAVWPLDTPAAPPPILAAGAAPGFQVDPSVVSDGEAQFLRKCSVCHSLTPDSGRFAGPTLYGLFGRPAGAVPDYAYSDALANSDLIWTPETVDALFDIGPDHYTPGTKMPMQRMTNAEEREALIAYLLIATAPEGAADEEP